jgi:hypothetical protein
MAPRRAKVNKVDYKKLTTNDVICPICRSILIKPITLPCSHGFCSSCFETTTQNANFVCPLCSVRVGSWLRSARKSKKLINESFWQAIQNQFPLQVLDKLKGVDENCMEEKYRILLNNKSDKLIKSKEEIINNQHQNDLQTTKHNKKMENKFKEQLNSVASTSAGHLKKTTGLVNSLSQCNNETLVNSEKNKKRANAFMNNFATKEYTCRILCQEISSKDTTKSVNESQTLLQKKNKRIQKITESETLNDRSNSIESECLYFKPIDYRHNPPSEGLAPIKVPTKKPNVNINVKIVAPSGQNQININSLESAFARLCSPMLSGEKMDTCKKENIDMKSLMQDNVLITSTKRRFEKSENKSKKKIKADKPVKTQLEESKEISNIELTNLCDTHQCKDKCSADNFNFLINNSNNSLKKNDTLKQPSKSFVNEEIVKRSLQEKADFELATKLQQTYNQSSKYSTRSTVLKRMASKNQVKMEGIMTPYKVK